MESVESVESVDSADVLETADELAVSLSAGGVLVLRLLLRRDALAEEVIDGDGTVTHGAVSSWALIGRDLTFELHAGETRTFRLDVPAGDLARVGYALLEILDCTCCIVDTPEGRIVR